MHPETSFIDDRHQRIKLDLRLRGIFFMLGGSIFLLQGLFDLKDTITWFLIFALLVAYVILSPRQYDKKHASWTKKAFQFLGWFALFLTASFAIPLGWGWIWKNTGIHLPYLAAITLGIIGQVLIGLSYIKYSTKS